MSGGVCPTKLPFGKIALSFRQVMGLQDNIAGTFNGAEQGKEFIPEYVEIAQSSDTFGCIIAKIGLQGSWIRGVALK